jgi:formylglycine-generating enzyme required for sulfatase activity
MRVVAVLVLFALAVFAQDRTIRPITVRQKLALVVGNAAYAKSPLVNPARDAAAVATELRGLGFTVTTRDNLNLRDFSRAVDDFAGRLQSGDLALFYYSGHGMQVDRENYLLPVDFEAASEADVPYAAYPANRVRDKLERSGARLRLLILDACRDNPYKTSKGGPSGLAPMGSTAEGTLIAFATGDNNTASDNPGQNNGLFTQKLLAAMNEPGLELHDIFNRVKQAVYFGSNKRQNPFTYDDVAGVFYFRPAGAEVPPVPGPARLDAAAEAWALVRDSKTPEDFDDFARSFPNSDLAAAARLRAAQLRRAIAPVIPAPTTLRAGQTKVNPKDGLTYVWIPPGTFMMGCSPGDTECKDDEKPPHQTTITAGFWMGQTPVTQEAFQRVTGTNPSGVKGDKLPVVSMTNDDARSYCTSVGMRLPTEAEWEYAARAGTTQSRYGDIDRIAWYSANSGGKIHEVAQKQPNAWGLYDMLGNVAQLTADWYEEGKTRVVRGAWAGFAAVGQRASDRAGFSTDRAPGRGFRCAGDI